MDNLCPSLNKFLLQILNSQKYKMKNRAQNQLHNKTKFKLIMVQITNLSIIKPKIEYLILVQLLKRLT